MRLLAFTEAPDHVCFRYRVQAFAPALAAHGCELIEVPVARGVLARIGQLRAARQADVVLVQRKLIHGWQLALLRHWSRALIYDFDDALFLRDSFARKGQSSHTRQGRFRGMVRRADLVLAGNAWLAEAAGQYSSRVVQVPTCVDPRRYPLAEHRRSGGDARLVWIGQRSTMRYLTLAQPCLAAVAQRVPGIRLDVISDEFPREIGIAMVPRLWRPESELNDLAAADIGISWLSDDQWTRGKCGLKLLQYMAAGLPVVANPVGTTPEMVIDGYNGFLASTPGEWAECVARLANDPSLRQQMGANARQFVTERYSIEHWAPKFVEAVQSLARPNGPPRRVRLARPARMSSGLASRVSTVLALLLLGLLGCVGVHDLPPTLPVEPVVVRDQLVMSSTFPLPHNHRLVEELVAQRYDQAEKLALPTSDEPIHVYLFDNAEKFQMFLNERFPHFPKRRAFFVETDTRLTVYAHWGDRIGEDLRHEIAHGYLHSVVPKLPLWLDEGLAEYFEVPRGQGGFNPPHVVELTQLLSTGWQPDLARLESLKSAGDMSQTDYAESWAWVHWCLEENPQAGDILRGYLAALRTEGKAEPLSAQLQRQFPHLRQMWLAHLSRLSQRPVEG